MVTRLEFVHASVQLPRESVEDGTWFKFVSAAFDPPAQVAACHINNFEARVPMKRQFPDGACTPERK